MVQIYHISKLVIWMGKWWYTPPRKCPSSKAGAKLDNRRDAANPLRSQEFPVVAHDWRISWTARNQIIGNTQLWSQVDGKPVPKVRVHNSCRRINLLYARLRPHWHGMPDGVPILPGISWNARALKSSLHGCCIVSRVAQACTWQCMFNQHRWSHECRK